MALKPDRDILSTDISYFVTAITGPNTSRMEAGGVVCQVVGTPGSGAGMDTSAQAVEYSAAFSGRRPVGVLGNEFVNIDLSRQILNPYKSEAQIGTKANLIKRGWVVTNAIVPGQGTGTMPADAFLGPSGLFTAVSGTGSSRVGQFLTRIDSDGYAKIQIEL